MRRRPTYMYTYNGAHMLWIRDTAVVVSLQCHAVRALPIAEMAGVAGAHLAQCVTEGKRRRQGQTHSEPPLRILG